MIERPNLRTNEWTNDRTYDRTKHCCKTVLLYVPFTARHICLMNILLRTGWRLIPSLCLNVGTKYCCKTLMLYDSTALWPFCCTIVLLYDWTMMIENERTNVRATIRTKIQTTERASERMNKRSNLQTDKTLLYDCTAVWHFYCMTHLPYEHTAAY